MYCILVITINIYSAHIMGYVYCIVYIVSYNISHVMYDIS